MIYLVSECSISPQVLLALYSIDLDTSAALDEGSSITATVVIGVDS